jgi:hypothetical protein
LDGERKTNPSNPPFKQSFSKSKGENTMNIMHYDYSDKTTVPTELLQDPYLSVDTKGLAAAVSRAA